MLGQFLNYFKPNNTNRSFEAAMYYATAISIATAINAITVNQSIFGGYHVGGRIRVAVCSVVYRKVFKKYFNFV